MSETPNQKFEKEQVVPFNKKRFSIATGGGIVGWLIWGVVVVWPLFFYFHTANENLLVRWLIWMVGFSLLLVFTKFGQYLALRIFYHDQG